MEKQELLQWAVKGIRAEIDELEKGVNRGKRLLLDFEKGITPKTPKTPQEIKDIIADKKAEIESLDKKRFELEWALTEMQA